VPDVAATAVKPMTGGTHKIQLVATKTEDEAKAELQRLRAKHGGVIGKLNTTIVRADLGEKGVFYRVQAGPLDAEGAKAACAQLRQQNAGCIVVRP
jgi:cell division septation protein DedD